MSLTTCIKKAGEAINADDKAAILDRSRELRGEGKSATEAAKQAVDEQIAKVRAMLGDATPAADKAPTKIDDDVKFSLDIEQTETQVKSAIGNRGTFDAGKKNILFSLDDAPAQGDTAPREPATERDRTAVAALQARLRRSLDAGLELDARPAPAGRSDGELPSLADRGRAAAADIAGRLFDKRVVFFESNRAFANGVQSSAMPNIIFIKHDATKPHFAVLGHELVHSMRQDREGLYDTLAARLATVMRDPALHGELLNLKRRAKGWRDLDADELREELVADIVGDNFTDPEFWRLMAKEQPGGFRKVLDAVLAFLDDVIVRLTGGKRPFESEKYLTDIRAARAAVADALRQYSGGEVGAVAGEGDVKLSAEDGTGLTVTGVQSAVDTLTKGWKNAPQIIVVQDMRDPRVPQTARDQLRRMQDDGASGSPNGFFVGGKVYLVADELPSNADVARVVFHEALGHHGLRGFFGDALDDILRKLAAAMPDRVAAKAKAYGLDMANERQRLIAAEEVLAEIAGERPSSTWVQKAIAAIKQWLRDNVPALAGLKLTDADVIATMILPARRFVEQGARAARGEPSAVPAFSLSQQPLPEVPAGDATPPTPKPPIPPKQKPLGLRHEPGWAMPEGTKFDDYVYKLQDKHIDLKRATQAIKAEEGEIADRWDAYLQEELFHGRAAKRTQDFVNHELAPLMAEMKLRELSIDDLDAYLHARHAEEANEHIAAINPDLPDGGSGMATAEAKAHLAGLDPAKRARLEKVAAKVDAMIAKTRGLYVAYGLESADTVQGWAELFKHYVPLMREDKDGGMGIGQGFSIRGKEAKHRTGSTAKVVDILANIAMQRERAIVRGEKNRVGVALAGLVKTNPNPDIWTFGEIPTEQVLNEKTGLVETRQKLGFKNNPNVLVVKIPDSKGKVHERAIVFNEHNERAMRMATALKNLDAAQLEGFIGEVAKVTRWFAAINTQYNPIFGVVNLARDIQGAALNLTDTALAGQRARIVSHALPALRGIYVEARKARKDKTSGGEWAKLWEEFQDQGGQTGFRDQYRTSEDRADALRDMLNPAGWMDRGLGKVFTAGGALKVPMSVAQKAARPLFDWLSDYNLAMENAIRLSAYKVGLEQGMTKQRAASLAKNLTVNFNRKGQAGQQLGALYAFFNAAMQGTARMGQVMFTMNNGNLRTLRLSKAGKAIMAGGVMLGVGQAVLLAAAGFDDDEPPQFVRERSLIVPIGDKKYISVPMPLGWHILPNVGRVAAEFALGGFKEPGKKVLQLAEIFAEAFNPMGGGADLGRTMTPTAADPIIDLYRNQDWTGKPIARESFDRTKPGHALARDTASAPAKWLSEAINTASGGTEFVRGALSPSPDQLDYLWGQVTGGVGRELNKLEQTVRATVSGESLPPHKIPLVGRFYGDGESPAGQASRFYDNIRRMDEHGSQLKGLRNADRDAEADAYEKRHPEAELVRAANRAEREVAKLRKEKSEAIKGGRPRKEIAEKEQEITERMREFNAEIEQARKPVKKAA